MRFINNDAIVLVHGRRLGVVGCVEKLVDEALDGCELKPCVILWRLVLGVLVFKSLDTVDIAERLELFEFDGSEGSTSLIAKARAID